MSAPLWKQRLFNMLQMEDCCPVPQVICTKQHVPPPFPKPSLTLEVNGNDIGRAIYKTGIDREDAHWTDSARYVTVPKKDFEAWLEYDELDKRLYIANLYDCDNFAHDLVTYAHRWVKGLALGEVWYTPPGHAINIFIDINMDVWTYEPQSDNLKEINMDYVHWMRL